MDSVQLPHLHADVTVTDAIAAMKDAARAAVTYEDSGRLWIVKAADLIVARKEGVSRLGDVERRHAALDLEPVDALERGLDVVRPWQSDTAYETFMDDEKTAYLAMNISFGSMRGRRGTIRTASTVTIVTRHEDLADELSTPGDYYCTGPRQHSYPPPRVNAGGPCPTGDGGIIVRG
jgi:hypothetical protein